MPLMVMFDDGCGHYTSVVVGVTSCECGHGTG